MQGFHHSHEPLLPQRDGELAADTLLALGANQVIGIFWQHPRPFMIGLGNTWMTHAADSSFPSDHITVFSGIGLTLLFGGEFRLAAGVLTTGFAVAWARVFVGIHFSLDMVGAVVVAGVTYVVFSPLWRKTGDTFTNLAEQMYRVVLACPMFLKYQRPLQDTVMHLTLNQSP